MMPRMDGIELIGHIRKQDSDVAIIVSAGYPSVDTAVDAMKPMCRTMRKHSKWISFETIEDVLKQRNPFKSEHNFTRPSAKPYDRCVNSRA